MLEAEVRTTPLPSGERVPVLGLGTWRMGERRRRSRDEVAALRLGIDLGMTLVDTAELYADGAAEELVGEAIDGRRGSAPLEETVEAFARLVDDGKVRHWGVSNFDVSDMAELSDLRLGGAVATDQVVYSLARRGIESGLMPWCQDRGLPVMAYSPVDQGRLLRHPVVQTVAGHHGATPAQVALAWVLRHDGVITIPKAGTTEHVRENRAALDVRLTGEDLAELDRAFPPPTEQQPLDVL